MKILLFDIETSPILANIWGLWTETRDFKFVDVDWYVLSWSAKWLNSKTTIVKSLPDYPNYKKNPQDDSALLKELWSLLDEADIVIGHNAQKFDVKKINTRFLINGMLPPSNYRVIDTLLIAKRHFAFTSNRLDTLGQILGLGKKVDTGGFSLWKGCLENDSKCWSKMRMYNKQDVVLLEKVYLKLRPYMNNHPNTNLDLICDTPACPICGSKQLVRRGYAYTNTSKYARVRCSDCGKWSRVRVNEISKTHSKNILNNII
jgi:hypothetical protein